MTAKEIVFVGIDVHDKALHGTGLFLETDEFVKFINTCEIIYFGDDKS